MPVNLWRRRARRLAVAPALVGLLALGACSTADDAAPAATPTGTCPADPVRVVVSVDQWGDLVQQLGGPCAQVTTVLASSSLDPHDYEPSPADAAAFSGADVVVVNGAHYDEWASKLAASSAPDATLVSAAQAAGIEPDDADAAHDEADGHGDDHSHEGDVNPHLWYSPTAVDATLDAVTAALEKAQPDATSVFTAQRAEVATSLEPYTALVAKLRSEATGKTYAATEGVFDLMAEAIGLVDKTPEGYRTAASHESDPSPADLLALQNLLADGGVDVLIVNTQTEGSLIDQVRAAASAGSVPVVEVTETVPDGAGSFQTWQLAQLKALAEALHVDA